MTSNVVDLVKINVLSSGTGSFTLGTAVSGFRGVEALTNGNEYGYSVQMAGLWEVGRGTYLSSTGVLTRGPIYSSNGGTAASFPPNAQIAFVALAEDLDAISLIAQAEAAAASAAVSAAAAA